MYSLSFFGSTISFCFSSSFSSLSNDGKLCIWVSFSLFSILGRGSVLRFSWGFHTTGGDRQVESTQKKMPGANRSLLRFMFALCLTLRAAKGCGGKVGSAYTHWTLFLFVSLYFLSIIGFCNCPLSPDCPSIHPVSFPFLLNFSSAYLGFAYFPIYHPPTPKRLRLVSTLLIPFYRGKSAPV